MILFVDVRFFFFVCRIYSHSRLVSSYSCNVQHFFTFILDLRTLKDKIAHTGATSYFWQTCHCESESHILWHMIYLMEDLKYCMKWMCSCNICVSNHHIHSFNFFFSKVYNCLGFFFQSWEDEGNWKNKKPSLSSVSKLESFPNSLWG